MNFELAMISGIEFLMIILGCIGVLAAVFLYPKKLPGGKVLLLFTLVLLLWVLAQSFRVPEFIQEFQKITKSSNALGGVVAATLIFVFALQSTGYERWLTPKRMLWLLAQPIAMLLLIWEVIQFEFLQVFFVVFERIYIAGLLLAATVIFSIRMLMGTPLLRRQGFFWVIGTIFPLFFPLIGLKLKDGTSYLAPWMFFFTAFLFLFVFFKYRQHLVLPITRNQSIEQMKDGWILINANNLVVDMNPVAEELLGAGREQIFGQPVSRVFEKWPNIVNALVESAEFEIRISQELREKFRYMNIRRLPLKNAGNQLLGHSIQLRDITDRRLVEDARQRARDEMFSLLHSVSGAASRSDSLDDFLTASMYQLVYSFQSQAGLFFLREDQRSRRDERRLLLTTHYGLPLEAVDNMRVLYEDWDLVRQLVSNQKSILIESIESDERIPPVIRDRMSGCMVMIPMITEDMFTGLICLLREDRLYNQDELVRLQVVAEQVAGFVRNDRRKQVAISLAERKRLVRDLHDSVSQKLYGLVLLTEAVRAGFNAGEKELPIKTIIQLGENARQALREMRLFLHELQPVDIERDGLIAILNQRLDSVEGRADLKPRFITDSEISLSLEKEVALYFIAMEALNNVLKHASASNVLVTLKQGRVNVKMEITDDGRGFDPDKVSRTGMGLRNMRERVNQINGKFVVKSAPGQGTTITITVKKDFFSKDDDRRR